MNDLFFFIKQKTAYEMRISDWSSDVCSSDLNINLSGALIYTGTGDSSDRIWTANGAAGIGNEGTGALALSGDMAFNPANPALDSITFGGTYAGTNTFSGVISGTGNLINTGSSVWDMSGANTREEIGRAHVALQSLMRL